MSNKTMMLVIAAILGMLLLTLVSSRDHSRGNDMMGQPVLPALASGLAGVTGVTLRANGGETRLRRERDGWHVADRFGYPAAFESLQALLADLASSRFVERKTRRPENYSILGITDHEVLEIEVSGIGDCCHILLGRRSQGGVFARFPEDDQVWLIDDVESVTADPASWLRPVVINVDAEQIVRVQFANDEASIVAERDPATGDFVLLDLPADAALKYDTVVDSLARGLINVRLRDVREPVSMIDARTARYHLADGGEILVRASQEQDEYWVAFELTPAAEDESSLVPEEARLEAFQYQVVKAYFDAFTRSLADLVKAPEPVESESP